MGKEWDGWDRKDGKGLGNGKGRENGVGDSVFVCIALISEDGEKGRKGGV